MNMLDRFVARLHQQSARWMRRYARVGVAPGWKITVSSNVWVFDSCNDLGVPYFHKLHHTQLFTVPEAERVLRSKLKNKK